MYRFFNTHSSNKYNEDIRKKSEHLWTSLLRITFYIIRGNCIIVRPIVSSDVNKILQNWISERIATGVINHVVYKNFVSSSSALSEEFEVISQSEYTMLQYEIHVKFSRNESMKSRWPFVFEKKGMHWDNWRRIVLAALLNVPFLIYRQYLFLSPRDIS